MYALWVLLVGIPCGALLGVLIAVMFVSGHNGYVALLGAGIGALALPIYSCYRVLRYGDIVTLQPSATADGRGGRVPVAA